MPFEKFAIAPKRPERVKGGQYRCNALVRVNENEEYCETIAERSSGRCIEHDIDEKVRAAKERARLSLIADPTSVGERVAELEKDKRNLTRLDELILNSLATIQELEKRFPLATVSHGDAIAIARLREKHAALVHQRVDLEKKLKTLLDTDFIYEKAAELFEKNVVDKNSQHILLRGIGEILNEIVNSGNAKVDETDAL